jgi:hypothetical protein
MHIDYGLQRDQKRLAMAKLASLGDDHHLGDKYREWIRVLDESIQAADLATDVSKPRSAGTDDISSEGSIVSASESDVDGAGKSQLGEAAAPRYQGGLRGPNRQGKMLLQHAPKLSRIDSELETGERCRKKLQFENERLRLMLARFAY